MKRFTTQHKSNYRDIMQKTSKNSNGNSLLQPLGFFFKYQNIKKIRHFQYKTALHIFGPHLQLTSKLPIYHSIFIEISR